MPNLIWPRAKTLQAKQFPRWNKNEWAFFCRCQTYLTVWNKIGFKIWHHIFENCIFGRIHWELDVCVLSWWHIIIKTAHFISFLKHVWNRVGRLHLKLDDCICQKWKQRNSTFQNQIIFYNEKWPSFWSHSAQIVCIARKCTIRIIASNGHWIFGHTHTNN